MIKEKCHKCDKKSTWKDYTGKNYCESHFLGLLEKRVRKNIRINKLISLKEKYDIQEDKENKHLLTAYFLRRIFSDRINLSKEGKKIVSNTLDDEAENLLCYFMKKEDLKQDIKPISVIADEEAKTLAKILDIKVKIQNKIHSALTKKEPQLLFSMLKSKEFIERRIKK